MLSGYGAVEGHDDRPRTTTPSVIAGRRVDPTLSVQLRIGFEPRGLLPDYMNDPVCGQLQRAAGPRRRPRTCPVRRGHWPALRAAAHADARPASQAMLERRAAALPAGLGKATDVVVDRADGALVFDVDGNTLIDFAGGIGMTGVGHCPPAVVDAVTAQTQKLLHTCALVATYEPIRRAVRAAQRESRPATSRRRRCSPTAAPRRSRTRSSSRARTPSGRRAVLRGRLSRPHAAHAQPDQQVRPVQERLRTVRARDRPPADAAAVPHARRDDRGAVRRLRASGSSNARSSRRSIRRRSRRSSSSRCRARPASSRCRRASCSRIRELCTQHGIVMIADEVQSGFGRTGTLVRDRALRTGARSRRHRQVARRRACRSARSPAAPTIMDAAHLGGVGGTYGGNPVTCVAAIAAVEMIAQPAFLAHARRLGEVMREVMGDWPRQWPIVGDVRGLGPMMLVELVARSRHQDAAGRRTTTLQIVRHAVANGVVLMRAGLFSNGVRLLPPLTMPEDMLREGLDGARPRDCRRVGTHGRRAGLMPTSSSTTRASSRRRPGGLASTVVVRDGRIAAVGGDDVASGARAGARRDRPGRADARARIHRRPRPHLEDWPPADDDARPARRRQRRGDRRQGRRLPRPPSDRRLAPRPRLQRGDDGRGPGRRPATTSTAPRRINRWC